MHELSLAASAIELIEDAARRDGFIRVRTVFMEIGSLSCVATDALQVAFKHAARDTCVAGARVDIHCVPAEGECPACGAGVAMETCYDFCPQCGAHPLKVLRGMEMRVVELEVE